VEAWHAFAIYTLWGAGSGSFWPAVLALERRLPRHARVTSGRIEPGGLGAGAGG
jgi:hypothetical protein